MIPRRVGESDRMFGFSAGIGSRVSGLAGVRSHLRRYALSFFECELYNELSSCHTGDVTDDTAAIMGIKRKLTDARFFDNCYSRERWRKKIPGTNLQTLAPKREDRRLNRY